jgi:hypothetical protein
MLESQQLINRGLLSEGDYHELREYIKEEVGDSNPELLNEAVGTILAFIGIGLSVGKGSEALGIIYRKLGTFFSGKKIGKTKAEKFGEKYHHAIIKGLTWVIHKTTGMEEDNAKLAANIIFWSLVVVTFSFGSLPSNIGIPLVVLKKFTTMIKSYEMGIVLIAAIIWMKIGSDLEEDKFDDLVHAVEGCVEDEGVKMHKIGEIQHCSMGHMPEMKKKQKDFEDKFGDDTESEEYYGMKFKED